MKEKGVLSKDAECIRGKKLAYSREEVNRVTFLLDEVFPVLHELLQGHHGVIVNVKFVVS